MNGILSILLLYLLMANIFAESVQDPKKFTIDETAVLTTAVEKRTT